MENKQLTKKLQCPDDLQGKEGKELPEEMKQFIVDNMYLYGAIIVHSICQWNAEFVSNITKPRGQAKETTEPIEIYKKTATELSNHIEVLSERIYNELLMTRVEKMLDRKDK